MNPITVLVVDDHPLYRQGIRSALSGQPDLQVVAEAGSADEALACLDVGVPDVVLLDINLPGANGVETARTLRERWPACGVVILTAHDDDPYVWALAEIGVQGYLLKSATDAEIVNAVRTVAGGGSVFTPAVTAKLVRRGRVDVDGAPMELTEREREVLTLVAGGRTNREIGHALGISERTAQAHLAHIFDKLGAASRTEAVTLALRHRLIAFDLGPGSR